MRDRLFRFLDRYAGRLPTFQKLEQAHMELHRRRESLEAQRDALAQERDEAQAHASRLADEVVAHFAREQTWGTERTSLLEQRDVLEKERDELSRHARVLSDTLAQARLRTAELEQRLAACAEQIEMLEHQRDTLEQERDELRGHAARLQGELDRFRLVWAPPGHFYSPIVDPRDPAVERIREFGRDIAQPLPGIRLDEARMLELFHRISRHYSAMPFPEQPARGFRYHLDNPAFHFADGVTWFGLLCELRPRRVIEAGVGYSSVLLLDTNDRFFDGRIDVTLIDPHPGVLLGLLGEGDPYRRRIRAQRLQEVPDEIFAELEPGDVLFIDSSHVLKTGSDVNDYLFRLLPLLRPGVVIHIHDVFYPFEYPAGWISDENRSWNEAYALRAFLHYNEAFEILYWNDLIYRKHRELTAAAMPLCLRADAGSFWLRKTKNGGGPTFFQTGC